MALTVPQIHAAASAIDASGQKPTLAGIRAKLGSGSYSTISAALQTWERQPDDKEEDVPSAIPDEVQQAADLQTLTIWQLAVKAARSEFDSERAQSKSSIALLNAKIQDLENNNQEMETMILSLEQTISSKENHTEALSRDLKNTNQQLNATRSQFEIAHQLATERLRTIEAFTITKTPENDPKRVKNVSKPKLSLNHAAPHPDLDLGHAANPG